MTGVQFGGDGLGGKQFARFLLGNQTGGRLGTPPSFRGCRLERGPGVVGRHVERLAQGFHLSRVEQLGVVQRVAGEWQSPALDGVGEDHYRSVIHRVRLGQHLKQARKIVSTQVRHKGPNLVVRNIRHGGEDGITGRAVWNVGQATAKIGPVLDPDQRLVLLIAHGVDAFAQRRASWARHRRF